MLGSPLCLPSPSYHTSFITLPPQYCSFVALFRCKKPATSEWNRGLEGLKKNLRLFNLRLMPWGTIHLHPSRLAHLSRPFQSANLVPCSDVRMGHIKPFRRLTRECSRVPCSPWSCRSHRNAAPGLGLHQSVGHARPIVFRSPSHLKHHGSRLGVARCPSEWQTLTGNIGETQPDMRRHTFR